jgi:hypothetical protein
MPVLKFNHGKYFGPSATFTGYTMLACGIIVNYYSISPVSLFLIIPGFFMSFTFSGTILDTENKRVKAYTSLFGIYKTGKWDDLNQYSRFIIKQVTDKYSSVSRGNVRLNMNITNIRLILANQQGSKAILIGKFKTFGEAQKVKEELSPIIFP